MKKSAFLLLTSLALTLFGCGTPEETSSFLSSTESISSVSSSERQTESSSSSFSTVSSSSTYSTVSSSESGSKWNVDPTLRGRELMVALSGLIKKSGGLCSSYSATKNAGMKAAAYPNADSSTFIPFYRAPTQANLGQSSECNREHTWPNSRGGNLFETDPVMVRPTFSSDNSARGNKFYGLGSSNEWDPATFGYENARGESARIILYCATTYYDLGVTLSNNPQDATSANTMGTLDTLLRWNREYAPNDFEKLVNDRYDALGYRRNPFVDRPEFAEEIFGEIEPAETTWYDPIAVGENLDGKNVIIASKDTNVGGDSYFMMNDIAKDKYPWYLTYSAAKYENGKLGLEIAPTYYTLNKQDSGYTLSTQSGKRLYSYISGTHYSICLATSEKQVVSYSSDATNIVDTWNITIGADGANIVSTSGLVYLECYRGSFCGYSKTPGEKPMLFA